MNAADWLWHDIQFHSGGELRLRTADDGSIAINTVQFAGTKYESRARHRYAGLPFCWFEIQMPRLGPGVYVYFVKRTAVYVGVTRRTMYERFAEYRSINARKCLRDGQAQSCRLNNLILQTYLAGEAIEVFYTITADVDAAEALEQAMILDLQPAWNIQGLV